VPVLVEVGVARTQCTGELVRIHRLTVRELLLELADVAPLVVDLLALACADPERHSALQRVVAVLERLVRGARLGITEARVVRIVPVGERGGAREEIAVKRANVVCLMVGFLHPHAAAIDVPRSAQLRVPGRRRRCRIGVGNPGRPQV
jgi:hypothetical protein